MEAHMSESLGYFSTCQHSNAERKKNLKTYQVSFSKYTLSVLCGGLIAGKSTILFTGLDNKL